VITTKDYIKQGIIIHISLFTTNHSVKL